ncbi:hypothetical protein K1T71_014312 [Dendrolimus kikuchii]|uniref:Uncharacterized protein n=1 Tax=Dendrolimus kikuchii TaxID=765133 RepID=A0ACC1CFN0_9NEOP|nr:hypothetical protein K1T71_014312 [Dendrolimus kikuchii]
MELIYSMRRKPLKCEPPHFESALDPEVTRPICTISVANIIAFSSPTELNDVDGDTWSGHVYVCDLDTPWDSHKVTTTSYPVSSLSWDCEGKQLLVATTVGEVSVYGQRDHLLNEWTCLYTANFSGEHIIASVFFHNGRRIVAVDKKPDTPIMDRIQMMRPTPTLKGFGGVPCEGLCVVTTTGLVGAVTPPPPSAPAPSTSSASPESPKALTATECLRATRDHITAASVTIAHKSSNMLVACVCGAGALRRCVRVFSVCVGRPPPPASALAVQPLPAIYLGDADFDASIPMSISWCIQDDTDSLLIACSTLTLWKCTERAHPVHKLLSKGALQGSTTPGGETKPTSDSFNTLVWHKTAVWPVVTAVGVASAKSPLGTPHVVVATPKALHLLTADAHHYLCISPVITEGSPGLAPEVPPAGAATPPKKPKYGHGVLPAGAACAMVSSVEMSQLGGVVVAIDTHAQLHVYKLPQMWSDIPTPLAVQQATSVLEYAMVSGFDCLDILLTLKSTIVEPVYERLTESFQRQAQTFQQYYFHSWLKIRIALCRIIASGQSSVSSLTSLQMCHAIWAACAVALRPDDKPEANVLAALIEDHSHDHDKSLLSLEAKTEVVNEALGLQCLRLALQRVQDIALTTLLTLSQQHQYHQSHGYELWSDPAAVTLLRKLVVLSRVSGRGGDPLTRPLARLAASNTPKPDLIEECAALCAQSTSPRVWESLSRCSVTVPHGKSWPLYFEYGVEPEVLRYNPEPPAYAQNETTPTLAMDSIRYMHLGGGWPVRWRQCGRCGTRALAVAQPTKHPAQRSYDARFMANCRCGGRWTLVSNV